jgi:cystathionine beta-lyase/cystathionine gamma-synthase
LALTKTIDVDPAELDCLSIKIRMAAVLSATSSYGALEVGERLVHSGAPGARNAAIVANFFSNHPKVACVHYPPLLPADHPTSHDASRSD